MRKRRKNLGGKMLKICPIKKRFGYDHCLYHQCTNDYVCHNELFAACKQEYYSMIERRAKDEAMRNMSRTT
jgi:hypothetical protein